jgi:hypothetical protein
MSHDPNPVASSQDSKVLRSALACFRATGFHACSVTQLVEATGLSWDDLCRRYVDKEGILYAALDLLVAAGDSPEELQEASLAPLLAMRARVRRLAFNSRLRALHRPVQAKLEALLDTDTSS